MPSRESVLQMLEPLAEQYVGSNRTKMFTPILAGSIFCGVTWGVLGLQYVKWIARAIKGQSVWTTVFATYLLVASTAYLGLLTAFMSYFFARNFGYYATAFDLTYTSWLFLLATVLIHVPCQIFYARNAYRVAGQSKIIGLVLLVMIAGIVGIGATLKAILADIVVNLSGLESFLIKFWIALSTATDVALTVILALANFRGKGKQTSEMSFLHKLKILVMDAQLPATLISVGLLVILMVDPSSPFTHLWLGLPLVYPINVLSTLGHRKSIREDIEAEAEGADRRASSASSKDEKPQIPPIEKRPSFLLSPFPSINIRRASDKIQQYTAPIIMPAISGVRRASQYLGVIPPLRRPSQPQKKRTFPFRNKSSSGRNSPVELHPSSLHYPLSDDAAPMGESELIPRGKALERPHSLSKLDTEPTLSIQLGQTSTHISPTSEPSPLPGHLSDPFANSSPVRGSRSPSPRPTLAEAIEAHEIFEMPSTPDMMSPKSGHSPLMVESPGFADQLPTEHNTEWK